MVAHPLFETFPLSTRLSPWLAHRAENRSWVEFLIAHRDVPAHTLNLEERLQFHAQNFSAEDLPKALRRLRQEQFALCLVRDVESQAPLSEIIQAMSRFADFAIRCMHDFARNELIQRFGILRNEHGEEIALHIVGMGKLGGGELNVSSDIDLIFLFPEEGQSDAMLPDGSQGKAIPAEDYLTRLGKKIINSLNDINEEGQVFRVDMRLRPHGDSGPLVMSFDAFEHYLIRDGREWERYAWIKGRLLCGDQEQALNNIVRPFVFRKYLDFTAMESMFTLHRQIREQVEQKYSDHNIKLGRGGIREIEFIAQLMQLMRGGRRPELQQKPTCVILQTLAHGGFMNRTVSESLIAHYDFLRRLEHRLQYQHDQQTQTLPDSTQALTLIAESLGLSLANFRHRLKSLQDEVSEQFTGLFEKDHLRQKSTATILHESPLPAETVLPSINDLVAQPQNFIDQCWVTHWDWHDEHMAERLMAIEENLIHLHLHPSLANDLIDHGKYSRIRALNEAVRHDHTAIIHHALSTASRMNREQKQTENTPLQALKMGDGLLRRMLTLIAHLARRPSYLRLLHHSLPALERLENFLACSAWGADYLCQHPILLDDLLDPRLFEQVFNPAQFAQTLQQGLRGDVGERMNFLREMHHTETFRLLAQDLQGMHSVEKLSDHLSALADVILQTTLQECWNTQKNRHLDAPKVAIIGYGKLGGKELGYASDLDLVIVRDNEDDYGAVAYHKLAISLTHWLSASTERGVLFETDYRLRPDGEAGQLVPTMAGFADYQKNSAWLWEHQALTRARFCAGDRLLGEQFEYLRHEILSMPRPLPKLTDDIREMREKMRANHPAKAEVFEIKHDEGGLIDIEFIVQWGVLGFAHRHPELTQNLGNIALLAMLGEREILPMNLALSCANAYRDLRKLQHVLRLNHLDSVSIHRQGIAEHRTAVGALWQVVFAQDLWKKPLQPKEKPL